MPSICRHVVATETYPSLPSVQPRNQPVRHDSTIFIPLLGILLAAFFFISPSAMNEQRAHVEEVAPRQKMGESASSAHCPCQDQVSRVVRVSA